MGNPDIHTGTIIKSGKGCDVEILGSFKKGSTKLYYFWCPKCSLDTELFPLGTLVWRSCHFVSGRRKPPCMCNSNKVKFDSYQLSVLLKRKAHEKYLIFMGYKDNMYKGSRTKIVLYNPITGNIWDTTTIHNFMNCDCRDPSTALERRGIGIRKDDKDIIDKYRRLSKYPHQNYTLKRRTDLVNEKGHKCYWEVHCIVCSEDIFSREGLCDGRFLINSNNISQGYVSCRCATNHTLPEKLLKFKVKTLLELENHCVISYGIFRNTETEVKVRCSKGHTYDTRVEYLIHSNNRCNVCTSGGYNKEGEGYFYITRWYGFGESYLKFGITSTSVESRIKSIGKSSKLDYEILKAFKGCAKNIMLVENQVRHFTKDIRGVCPKSWMQDGYTETLEDTKDNIDLLLSYLGDFQKVL